MSGSVVLLQPGCALTSMACFSTKGHRDALDLSHHLCSCLCPRAMLLTEAIQTRVTRAANKHRGVVWAESQPEPCLGLWPSCNQGLH